ncbi:MAG: primosomal protein N' [Elusimicrobiota bacterium]|jgi:primosomal protein N' (replication factor Y)|nr:primosomal protein N' [Elusimicrobiota bacterium]
MTILEVAVPIPINKTFHYLSAQNIIPADIIGRRVKVPFGQRKLIGYALREVNDVNNLQNKSNFKLKEILEVIDCEPIIYRESIELAKYMSENYICSIGEAVSSIISPSMKAPKRISKKKAAPYIISSESPLLNSYQQNAVDLISQSILNYTNPQKNNFLIHGVTGSGKTEIYLNCIDFAIKNGKSAIMLIPEISLTAQFVETVTKRFGDIVGVWHSGISNIDKYKLFCKSLHGEIKIMLGTRSAIFAPFKNIGIIVIDEEHEDTYKQEQKPSYDAREIAFWRGEYHEASVVLGSATPSLETYKSALENKMTLIKLPERIDKKDMPNIEIISLKNRLKAGGLLLSETVDALSKTLARKEQAIVFLNRRGFSTSLMCKNCQTVYQCPNCSISMVYHSKPASLRCHYCGYVKNLPAICPECKSKEIAVFGRGTQRVEDELNKLFPSAKIFRLDKDTASLKENYGKAYHGIKNDEYDILLGTQMIAKGFDFPRVSLVCIIDADTSLYLPDFKSAEKTFQIITQVAGRCGRGKTQGNAIIQTSRPEHYAIKYAKTHDYESFYQKENSKRQAMFYPPFCDISKIVIKNKDNDRCEIEADNLIKILENIAEQNKLNLKLLGPAPAYIAKLYNVYRQHIIIKGMRKEILRLMELSGEFKKKFSDTQIGIEMSPSNLI